MLTADEKVILEDYKKAFAQYYASQKKGIINLDEKIRTKLDYVVTRLEDVLPDLRYTIPPIRHSTITVNYFTNGKGTSIIGKLKVDITAGTLIAIPSRTVHSGMYSTDTIGYYISFNLKFFLQKHLPRHHFPKMKMASHQFIPYINTDLRQNEHLVNIFETLLDEHVHQKTHKEEMIALKILELILVCERLFKIEKGNERNVLPITVVQYIDLIQNSYKEHHSTAYYAKKLNLHPNSLNALSKKYFGETAKNVIDTKLLSEAQYLLQHTSLSAKEIAYELGFKSSSHFFRFFKRQSGQSPLGYRRQHLILQ